MFSIQWGIVLILAALACGVYALSASPVSRVPADRRTVPGTQVKPVLEVVSERIERLVDNVLKSRGWTPVPARELELAGIQTSQSTIVTSALGLSFVAFMIGLTLNNLWIGLLLALIVPFVARAVIARKKGKRQAAFGDQLESTLEIISSALRAGHSFPRALDTVSGDSQSPTKEEFARIVNENRLGRDLIEAMHESADRMDCQDFDWVTDAVAIQRDTGGNLGEVLTRVGTTIRERNELAQQVQSISAEGRFSGWVMMAMPVVLALFYLVTNPDYLSPLFSTNLGRVLLVVAAILYGIGYFWIRAIVKVKF